MKSFKEKHGLTTARATDLKSYVYNAGIAVLILEKIGGSITEMEAGWDKTLLLVLFMGALSFINWLQVGNNPPGSVPEPIDPDLSAEKALREGREP